MEVHHTLSMLIVLVCASQAGAVESTTMAYANNATDFALKLFAEITKQPDATNVFFSPYSISTAMAMLYIGSDGDTKAQLARVMGYPTDMAAALGAARNLQRDVFIESEDYELEAANTLFVNEGYDVLDEYTDNLETYFDAEIDDVDFISDPGEAREEINDWVAKKTKNNIKTLFEEGTITSTTLMVLVNALYFKADWLYRFSPDNTKTEPFNLGEGKTQDVSMMHLDQTYMRVAVDNVNKLKVLELPYRGDTLAMYIILPHEDQHVNTVGELLSSSSKLNEILDSLPPKRIKVNVALPKFKITQQMKLPSLLRALGITDVFTGKADLSGIDPDGGVRVSDVVHQAYISINEKGTEATAATGLVLSRMSMIVNDFKVDRPFIVLIRDKTSGCVLFMGRVVNPSTATEPLLLRSMRSVGNPPPEGNTEINSATLHAANLGIVMLIYVTFGLF